MHHKLSIIVIFLNTYIDHMNSVALNSPFKFKKTVHGITYETLCMTDCLCGTMSHPLQRVVNKGNTFMRYQSRQLTEETLDEYSYGWFSHIAHTTSLTYPANIIFCLQQPFQDMPKTNQTSMTSASGDFISKQNILVLTQGSLRSVTSSDLRSFKETLQFIDLSQNRISTLSSNAFSQLTKLQIVDLRFNYLHELGSDNTGMVTAPWVRPILFVSGNPLLCSCGLTKTVATYVTMPLGVFSCCGKIQTDNSTPICDHNIGIPSIVHELHESLCEHQKIKTKPDVSSKESIAKTIPIHHDPHSQIPKNKFRVRSDEEQHHAANQEDDATDTKECGKHDPAAEAALHALRIYKSRGQIDVPLLITMAGWFIMLYLGISKFIQANELDKDRHSSYLSTLNKDGPPS